MVRSAEVTRRSVRRYITMLQDLGIPVEAERGRNGGYRLRPGYKLPPLMFTNNEAMAVTLGLINVNRLGITSDEPAIEGALAKISRVLPEGVRHQVQSVQDATVLDDEMGSQRTPAESVFAFSQAVQQQRQVWIRYQAPAQETTRIVDPYGLVLREGVWYVVGWCHLRADVRVFRLDRVSRYRILSQTFIRPHQFDAREAVISQLSSRFEDPAVEVVLHTDLSEAKRWVSIVSATLEETGHGVVMRCNVGSLEWLALFLISMPWPVTVRKPVSLMDELSSISARIATIGFEPIHGEREGVVDHG
jgi:predicted DNA-binding transcriptional regulator YafY